MVDHVRHLFRADPSAAGEALGHLVKPEMSTNTAEPSSSRVSTFGSQSIHSATSRETNGCSDRGVVDGVTERAYARRLLIGETVRMRIRAAVLEEFGQPLVVQDLELEEPPRR